MKNVQNKSNNQSHQLKLIAYKFLKDPLSKYHCGYKINNSSSDNVFYHSVKTSLLPEFIDYSKHIRVSNFIKYLIDYQKIINELLINLPCLKSFVGRCSPKSEIDLYKLNKNESLFTIQRIDYINNVNGELKIIDPNVLPLGLGLFFLRSDMMEEHYGSIKNYFMIENDINTFKKFDLAIVANVLKKWKTGCGKKDDEVLHLVTENGFGNNLDHELVCKELKRYFVNIKISYIEDLRFDFKAGKLLNSVSKEAIELIWRYGRFPNKKLIKGGWLELYKAINAGCVNVINKPGIYALENKLFLSIPFVDGFEELLRLYGGNNLYNLKKYLPESMVVKIDRLREKAYYALSIDLKGRFRWGIFDLKKLPRSFVFKTTDTSGSRGVRLVLNESNRKCQKYFWDFVELYPDRDVFIVSEFIKPEKRLVVDPSNKELLSERFITKDHVFFTSNLESFDIIGFSAFARKNSYKVHGSQDTVSIVQFY